MRGKIHRIAFAKGDVIGKVLAAGSALPLSLVLSPLSAFVSQT
jgi:hypothetical protein